MRVVKGREESREARKVRIIDVMMAHFRKQGRELEILEGEMTRCTYLFRFLWTTERNRGTEVSTNFGNPTPLPNFVYVIMLRFPLHLFAQHRCALRSDATK
jgi:hypothetical protein